MTSPGLDNRLRQHGRRAGAMVGLSMALTIAVCIGGGIWMYLQLDPLTRDFVTAATAAPTKKPTTPPAGTTSTPAADDGGNSDTVAEVPPTRTPKPEPTATVTSAAFQATHRISLSIENAVNLRPGPAVSSGDPVAQLQPGTELQYLGQTEDSQDPDADPGVQWMKVRTADGIEGWILTDFVEEINNPG